MLQYFARCPLSIEVSKHIIIIIIYFIYYSVTSNFILFVALYIHKNPRIQIHTRRKTHKYTNDIYKQ